MEPNRNKGITLLIAMLILSSVLVVALSVFFVFFSQLDVSRGVKQSLAAYYGANLGKECAMYYRNKMPTLEEGLFQSGFWSEAHCGVGGGCDIQCGGKTVHVSNTNIIPPSSGYKYENVYAFTVDNPGGMDVKVDVRVRIMQKPSDFFDTIVESRGRTYGSGPFVVERAVKKCEPRSLCKPTP